MPTELSRLCSYDEGPSFKPLQKAKVTVLYTSLPILLFSVRSKRQFEVRSQSAFLVMTHSERRRLLNELQVLYSTFLYRDCDPGLGMDRKPCSAGSRERISGHRRECSMHGSATRTGKSRLKKPKHVGVVNL
jgi:hypothetical protein